MTIPARHPAKANQPEFDDCIDTDACRLIDDQALMMAPIFDAEPFIPRQSALSIDAPADLPRRHRPVAAISHLPIVTMQTV
jgi:hypothetical protein